MSTNIPLAGRLLEAARTALWANLRLVVIDLETCAPPGGGTHRVVEVAAVTCRRGATRGTWSKPVNPECPIDPVTRNIHGITDDLVADEPTFDAIAPRLVDLLAGHDDERVVLVAHNVRSDVSVLRAEFARVCPSCETHQPCPLDTWREPLAPLAVGDLHKRARSFLRPNGRLAGTGAYTTWLERDQDQQLADAALALVVEHWHATDQDGWADTVAQHGWDAGCRHPDIAEAVATLRAAPGTAADLTAALAIVDTALAAAEGSTAPGWTRLEARRAQLAGRLRRVRSGRPTGGFDADGNPIYATPHHP